MPAEGTVEIGQIREARLGGNVSDLAAAPIRFAQKRGGRIQAAAQYVMREALAGFFEQEVHIARRDAELFGDRQRTEIWIGTAMFDYA